MKQTRHLKDLLNNVYQSMTKEEIEREILTLLMEIEKYKKPIEFNKECIKHLKKQLKKI